MSPSAELVGLKVDVVVNDPWDLTASDGSVRHAAKVSKAMTFAVGADEERLLIEFRDLAAWHGHSYRFFVARHRHGYGLADDLLRGYPVECSLVAVSDEQSSSPEVLNVTGWRGGLAARATLEPRLGGVGGMRR